MSAQGPRPETASEAVVDLLADAYAFLILEVTESPASEKKGARPGAPDDTRGDSKDVSRIKVNFSARS